MAWLRIDDDTAKELVGEVDPDNLLADEEVGVDIDADDEEETRKPYTFKPRTEAEIYGTKNRWIAFVLAWLLGWLGAHKFYMGYTKQGLILLGCTIAGSLLTQVHPLFVNIASGAYFVAFVEGIIYIVRGKEGFYYTYEKGYRGWF